MVDLYVMSRGKITFRRKFFSSEVAYQWMIENFNDWDMVSYSRQNKLIVYKAGNTPVNIVCSMQ